MPVKHPSILVDEAQAAHQTNKQSIDPRISQHRHTILESNKWTKILQGVLTAPQIAEATKIKCASTTQSLSVYHFA